MTAGSQLELKKQILFALDPELHALEAMDNETLSRILSGATVSTETSNYQTNMDLQFFIDRAREILPIASALLSILKTAYDLSNVIRDEKAANDIYNEFKKKNPDLAGRMEKDTIVSAIKKALTTWIADLSD